MQHADVLVVVVEASLIAWFRFTPPIFTRCSPRMFPLSHEPMSIKIGYNHNEISVVAHKNTHMMAHILCERYTNPVNKLTTISTHGKMPAAVYPKKKSPDTWSITTTCCPITIIP
ncbi:predicted protein [Lichtheimia corymbifera JMRC:FSU:9682]|uniref:Uncharacterized protein n=1 Tax=Lichtheimia corymbifera JMRC:FSU:9682 TaxID=1263082 RepID=A0A068SBT4_9FUNG|nr:predicted protein [Lichtheimia corymbifera JMRC:FSU:9682]